MGEKKSAWRKRRAPWFPRGIDPSHKPCDVLLKFCMVWVQNALLKCARGSLDFEQWPLSSGTLCYFANVSMALLKAMKQQLVVISFHVDRAVLTHSGHSVIYKTEFPFSPSAGRESQPCCIAAWVGPLQINSRKSPFYTDITYWTLPDEI